METLKLQRPKRGMRRSSRRREGVLAWLKIARRFRVSALGRFARQPPRQLDQDRRVVKSLNDARRRFVGAPRHFPDCKRLLPEVRGLLRDGRIAGLHPKLQYGAAELNVRVRSTRGLSGSNAPYARFEWPRARSRQPLGRRRPRRARARRSSPRAGACPRRPALS